MSVSDKKNNSSTKIRFSKKAAEGTTYAVVTDEVGNYEKHPFFIKKANKAKETLKKVGLPEGLGFRVIYK